MSPVTDAVSGNRRPLVVLGVAALAAVLLFVFGATRGGGGDLGAWRQWLSGHAPAPARLGVADLVPRSGPCTTVPADQALSVAPGAPCILDVATRSALAVTGTTRRATLVVSSPVQLVVVVAGSEIRPTDPVSPGDSSPTRLTFGTDGGSVALTCLPTPTAQPCRVVLAP